MPTKAELQEDAEALGIDFTTSDTKADLEAKIAEATAGDNETGTQETGDFRCPVCGKLANHVHADVSNRGV